MPARDGTGPLGQGSRTGRGMGNCRTTSLNTGRTSTTTSIINGPFHWGGRVWDFTFGRLFGRQRANRINRR
jgi:hypothetical protein